MKGRTPPKSTQGKAIYYLLEQWPYLTGYLEDGCLELSINRAECSIKPFVMGRKSQYSRWRAGQRCHLRPIETAKENGLDSY